MSLQDAFSSYMGEPIGLSTLNIPPQILLKFYKFPVILK